MLPGIPGMPIGALPKGVPLAFMLPGRSLPMGGGMEGPGIAGIAPGAGPNNLSAVQLASPGSKAQPASDGLSASPCGLPMHRSRWGNTWQMGSSGGGGGAGGAAFAGGGGSACAGPVAGTTANPMSATTMAALVAIPLTIEAIVKVPYQWTRATRAEVCRQSSELTHMMAYPHLAQGAK